MSKLVARISMVSLSSEGEREKKRSYLVCRYGTTLSGVRGVSTVRYYPVPSQSWKSERVLVQLLVAIRGMCGPDTVLIVLIRTVSHYRILCQGPHPDVVTECRNIIGE